MSPDPGGLPRTWLKSLIPVGFLLLGLQGVAESLRLRWKLMHGDEPSDNQHPAQGDKGL
jgi:TRAP-type mannitol/chloroaromatic compound transport system permease small subunit